MLWFGPKPNVGPAELVGPLLQQNELVTDDWSDGDVEVLVCENQGVWLWGRKPDGRFVERENVRDAAGHRPSRTRSSSGCTTPPSRP